MPTRPSFWRAKTTLGLLLGSLLGSVLGLSTGCGQKGPLTLPGAAKGGATAPAASAPASR